VDVTTGVVPIAPHVVPAWWSERIPASSAKYTVAPAFFACFAIAGYSRSFQAATFSGSACQARHSGRCGDSPSRCSIRPTAEADIDTLNSRAINSRTNCRVHSAKSNCSCRGSLPTTRS
jgi:hypothetical protein